MLECCQSVCYWNVPEGTDTDKICRQTVRRRHLAFTGLFRSDVIIIIILSKWLVHLVASEGATESTVSPSPGHLNHVHEGITSARTSQRVCPRWQYVLLLHSPALPVKRPNNYCSHLSYFALFLSSYFSFRQDAAACLPGKKPKTGSRQEGECALDRERSIASLS